MSFFNIEKRYKDPSDANRHELNKWVFIFRLGNSSNWRCNLCKRTDDLPAMLKHHLLEGWTCWRKWKKLEWDEQEKEHPSVKIDPNNHRLDEF